MTAGQPQRITGLVGQPKRWLLRRARLVGLLTGVVLSGSLLVPATSMAACGGIPVIRDIPGVQDLNPSCFVQQVFGVPSVWPPATLAEWVIKIEPYEMATTGSVAQAETVTQAAGLALLGALVTFVVFYYFATGLAGGGGSVVDAVVRVAGAALFIAAWPWLFRSAMTLTQVLSNDLIPTGKIMGEFFPATWVITGPFNGITNILLDIGAVIVSFGLVGMKLALSAGLLVAFIITPIAIALWAVPALAGPAEYPLRMCGMVITTQLAWAVCIMVIADLAYDTRGWNSAFGLGDPGGGAAADNLIKPLVVLAALWGMLRIPAHTARAWNVHKSHGTGRGLMLAGLLALRTSGGNIPVPAAGRAAGAHSAGGGSGAVKGAVYSGLNVGARAARAMGGHRMPKDIATERAGTSGGGEGRHRRTDTNGGTPSGSRGGQGGGSAATTPPGSRGGQGGGGDAAQPAAGQPLAARGPSQELLSRSNGLHTDPGQQDISGERSEIDAARRGGAPDRAAVATSLGNLINYDSQLGPGLRNVVGDGGSAVGDGGDRNTIHTMADAMSGVRANAGRGVPQSLAGDYRTIGAARPEVRRAGARDVGLLPPRVTQPSAGSGRSTSNGGSSHGAGSNGGGTFGNGARPTSNGGSPNGRTAPTPTPQPAPPRS